MEAVSTNSSSADVVAAIAALVAAVLVFIGLFFAWVQIRQTRKGRHAQVLKDMAERWDDEPMFKARQAQSSKKYETGETLALAVSDAFEQSHDDDLYYHLLMLPNFFDHLGFLAKRKVVTVKDINDTIGGPVVFQWKRWEKVLPFFVSQGMKEEDVYDNFRWLAEQLQAIQAD